MNVAIVGKFCSGKTTLADLLADQYGFRRVSMAANLKNIVLEAYGTLDKSANVEVVRRDGTTEVRSVRSLLQALGEVVKDVDRDLWLRWFLNDTALFSDPLVMDDARLHFEADYLRRNGWLLVKLEAPLDVRLARFTDLYNRIPTSDEMRHPTEIESEFIHCDLHFDSSMFTPETMAELVMAEIEDRMGR